ncbi:MAG: B12-binding domain-containing radical SAM protein, partial [Clostridiales bacterium]
MQIDYLLKQVEKPSRYIGGEVNSVNKEIREEQVRFGFAFPDVYEVGMSFMGLQILYFLLNDMEDVYCERLFAPWTDMEKVMRESETPLFTMESRTPAGELDIIGFTLQYEMSYSNILNMMDLAGLPVFAKERDDSHPIVIAGGPCAFNPEPIADFVDVVFIGDSEDILPVFIERFKIHKSEKTSRYDFLKSIIDIPGIYVPSFYEPVYKDGIYMETKSIEKEAPAVVKKN